MNFGTFWRWRFHSCCIDSSSDLKQFYFYHFFHYLFIYLFFEKNMEWNFMEWTLKKVDVDFVCTSYCSYYSLFKKLWAAFLRGNLAPYASECFVLNLQMKKIVTGAIKIETYFFGCILNFPIYYLLIFHILSTITHILLNPICWSFSHGPVVIKHSL